MTGFSIESTLDWNGLIVGSFWFFGIYIDIKESSTEIPIVMGVIPDMLQFEQNLK